MTKQLKDKAVDLAPYTLGKVQPQALDLEEAVLGGVMMDKDAIAIVIDILTKDDFYSDAHCLIYDACLQLFNKTLPIDIMTVKDQLEKMGELENIGGAFKIINITSRVASSANIEYHARIVKQKSTERQMIKTGVGIIEKAFDPTISVNQLQEFAELEIYGIAADAKSTGFDDINKNLSDVLKKIETASQSDGSLTGVPSGFIELDKLTSGWQAPDLIILAARPGMGKTALTLALAKNCAMNYGLPVAFFSLEMSNMQLTQRLVSLESGISGSKLRNGQLYDSEWQDLQNAIEKLQDVPIFMDDTPALNIFELRAKCRRLKIQHDIQMVIVDYLQLMSGVDSKGAREQEVSSISRGLKSLAKELSIPVIALSQLSRAVETRGGSKRPQLSDLRESGAIEQDADIVSFIYRPEYYQILEDEEGQSLKGVAEVIIAKHRNGALKTVKLKFEEQYARFKNLDDPDFSSIEDAEVEQSQNYGNLTGHKRKTNDDDIPW